MTSYKVSVSNDASTWTPVDDGFTFTGTATPESKKGSPKVSFPFKAVVFKSGERGYLRF